MRRGQDRRRFVMITEIYTERAAAAKKFQRDPGLDRAIFIKTRVRLSAQIYCAVLAKEMTAGFIAW